MNTDSIKQIVSSYLNGYVVGIGVRVHNKDIRVSFGEVKKSERMTEKTQMYGASLTKQFIGVLTAQLVTEKKLDVEQSIREYIQELPPWADKIRIRHLLSHTSGFPVSNVLTDQLGLPSGPDGERQWNNAMVLSALKAQSEPQRPPGTGG